MNSNYIQFTLLLFWIFSFSNAQKNTVNINGIDYVSEEIKPIKITNVNNNYVLDFGKDAFATLEFEYTATIAHTLTLHFGEKLKNNVVDRIPGGTIRYQKQEINVNVGTRTYQVNLTPDSRNTKSLAVVWPNSLPIITPYRYLEIENAQSTIQANNFTQIAYFGPWNDDASSFESDNDILNQVWDLCRYSIKATSFMGYYIDGDRERIPYEADSYLNQLSHYGTDANYEIARRTIPYLMENPTWPIEWHQHMPFMIYADYMYTANTELITEYYDLMIDKSLYELRRGDGLISEENATEEYIDHLLNNTSGFTERFEALTDWPQGERDGFVFKAYNNVINALYYKDLIVISEMAAAIGKSSDAELFANEAEKVYNSFNNTFFDTSAGVYIDGEGTNHVSLHANLFPLAMGLVPEESIPTVITFIKSKGMACGVYPAQYLMQGLFEAGEADYALELLTSTSERSWYNMIADGSTITTEAWDINFKSNQDWNHAWSSAPANIIPNYLWGIQPKVPGYSVALIQPQLGSLQNSSIKTPTIHGSIVANHIKTSDDNDLYTIELPSGIQGEFSLQNTIPNLLHNGIVKTNVQNLSLNAGEQHTVEVLSSNPPHGITIDFEVPENNTSYDFNEEIILAVNTKDSNGTISAVSLYLDDNLISEDTTSPYEWLANSSTSIDILRNLSSKTYNFKAVATDNLGNTLGTSILITIKEEEKTEVEVEEEEQEVEEVMGEEEEVEVILEEQQEEEEQEDEQEEEVKEVVVIEEQEEEVGEVVLEEELEKSDKGINIYPNPIENQVYVEGAAGATIRIYDVSGRIIFTRSIFNETEIIYLNNLSSGIYYAEMLFANEKKIIELIKN